MKFIINTIFVLLLLASCKSGGIGGEFNKGEDLNQKSTYESLYSIDSTVQVRHKLSQNPKDSIEIVLDGNVVKRIPYSYIDSTYLSRGRLQVQEIGGNWKKRDLFIRDSVIYFPLNDINSRSVLFGFNLTNDNSIFVNGEPVDLVSTGKFYIDSLNNIIVQGSRMIDQIKVFKYFVKNDNYIQSNSNMVNIEGLNDSIIVNSFN